LNSALKHRYYMAMDSTVRDDPIISPLLEHQHQDFPRSYEGKEYTYQLGRPHEAGANVHCFRRGPSGRSCSPLRFIFFHWCQMVESAMQGCAVRWPALTPRSLRSLLLGARPSRLLVRLPRSSRNLRGWASCIMRHPNLGRTPGS
jgi:hypothetical protein